MLNSAAFQEEISNFMAFHTSWFTTLWRPLGGWNSPWNITCVKSWVMHVSALKKCLQFWPKLRHVWTPAHYVKFPDPKDPQSLTPGHFRTGGPLMALPDIDYSSVPMNMLSCWQSCNDVPNIYGSSGPGTICISCSSVISGLWNPTIFNVGQ